MLILAITCHIYIIKYFSFFSFIYENEKNEKYNNT